jgi:hypothetical protein
MEVFDQQVATARHIAEQRADLVVRGGIDTPPARRRAHASAARRICRIGFGSNGNRWIGHALVMSSV